MQQTNVADMIPNRFEPKREFRWIVKIDGIDSFLLSSASRPAFDIKPGLTRQFRPMTLKLYDPVAPSGSQQIMKWVDGYPSRDLLINLLDPEGNVIEQWKIYDAKLTAVDFGQLDYASNMACTITLSIDYRDFELIF